MDSKDYYLYKDAQGVAKFADTPRMSLPDGTPLDDAGFDQAVMKVVLNGFPNNQALQDKYNLSDEEFRMVTQEAFHYYADNQNPLSRISNVPVYLTVYEILIGKVADDAMKPVPDNAVINILEFDPNSAQNFQNLITVDFLLTPNDPPPTEPTSLDVLFSKVAAGQGGELAGATLTVTGGDDVSVEWVSTGEAKQIALEPGEYVLTETAAPEGYLIANAIEFRVTDDLTLEIKAEDGSWQAAEDATVQMVDELAPTSPAPEEPEAPAPVESPKEPEPVQALAKTGASVAKIGALALVFTAAGVLMLRRREEA